MDADDQLEGQLLNLRYALHTTHIATLTPHPSGGEVVSLPMDTALAPRKRPVAAGWTDHLFVEVIDHRQKFNGTLGWIHRSQTNWNQRPSLQNLLPQDLSTTILDACAVCDALASPSANPQPR